VTHTAVRGGFYFADLPQSETDLRLSALLRMWRQCTNTLLAHAVLLGKGVLRSRSPKEGTIIAETLRVRSTGCEDILNATYFARYEDYAQASAFADAFGWSRARAGLSRDPL
jgi:hypothetical protein